MRKYWIPRKKECFSFAMQPVPNPPSGISFTENSPFVANHHINPCSYSNDGEMTSKYSEIDKDQHLGTEGHRIIAPTYFIRRRPPLIQINTEIDFEEIYPRNWYPFWQSIGFFSRFGTRSKLITKIDFFVNPFDHP